MLVLSVTVFLVACASGPPLKPFPSEKVSASEGRIHIARTTDFLYMALAARVSVNGAIVGALPRGGVTFADVAPGIVTVRVDHPTSPGAFAIQFQVKPGTTYNVEVSPRGGSFIPGAFFGVIGLSVDASITENSGLFMVKLASVKEGVNSPVQHQESVPNAPIEEQLKRLKNLKEKGLIDEEVYKEEQKRILSQ